MQTKENGTKQMKTTYGKEGENIEFREEEMS